LNEYLGKKQRQGWQGAADDAVAVFRALLPAKQSAEAGGDGRLAMERPCFPLKSPECELAATPPLQPCTAHMAAMLHLQHVFA
jgi:hypothetical protein